MRHQPNVVAAVVLTAAVAGVATVSAQTPPGAQANPATRQLAPGLSEKPYSRLFDKQLVDVDRQLSETAAALQLKMRPNSARRFICGMPVLPADSAIDPKFEVPLPDMTTRFTMRIIIPMPCR